MEEVKEIKNNQLGHVIAIIPAYNEEKNIKRTIYQIPSFVHHTIVINDGSRDKTEEEVLKIKNKKIHLINHEKNLGKGSAVLSGFRWILENHVNFKSDDRVAIVLMDGDGQMDPKYIESLVKPIISKKYDLVKASRFLNRTDNNNMPKFRRFGNIILKYLNKISSGYWYLTDPQNGFFASSLRVLRTINLNNIDGGYFFENSFLIESRKHGFNLKEIPLSAVYGVGEDSSINYLVFIPSTSIKLLSAWIDRLRTTRKHNKLRNISHFSLILAFIFGILSILSYFVKITKNNLLISICVPLVILLTTLSMLTDYKDFINSTLQPKTSN